MVIVFKKSKLFIFLCVFIVSVTFGGYLFSNAPHTTTSTLPTFGKTIVLDAGHGYPDGGAVGISGSQEDVLNLKVTLFLRDYLEKSGVNVILTRKNENGIFDESATSIKQKKVSDMHERERIMNESEADLFVSIHMNKFTDSKYSGPQVFYAPQFEEGKAFAENIQNELIAELKPKMEREIKKATSSIYLLKKAQLPAVLVECGFLSNAEEERLLNTTTYQKKIAWAIYKGITTYYSLN